MLEIVKPYTVVAWNSTFSGRSMELYTLKMGWILILFHLGFGNEVIQINTHTISRDGHTEP